MARSRPQSDKRYLITNTTRKQPKYCPDTGRDLRTVDQKKGFTVSFRDRSDRQVMLHPDRQPSTVVDEIQPGLLQMRADGHISIREVESISDVLKEHATPAKQAPKKRPTAKVKDEANAGASAPQERTLFPEEETKAAGSDRMARAVQMGDDAHTQRGGSEHEGAVNPSGDPNFVVRAPTGAQGPKRRSNKTAAAPAE